MLDTQIPSRILFFRLWKWESASQKKKTTETRRTPRMMKRTHDKYDGTSGGGRAASVTTATQSSLKKRPLRVKALTIKVLRGTIVNRAKIASKNGQICRFLCILQVLLTMVPPNSMFTIRTGNHKRRPNKWSMLRYLVLVYVYHVYILRLRVANCVNTENVYTKTETPILCMVEYPKAITSHWRLFMLLNPNHGFYMSAMYIL